MFEEQSESVRLESTEEPRRTFSQKEKLVFFNMME